MGSPTVQRTKTPAQTLVAHLLAVVDFRASQQPGTRQSCKGEEEERSLLLGAAELWARQDTSTGS